MLYGRRGSDHFEIVLKWILPRDRQPRADRFPCGCRSRLCGYRHRDLEPFWQDVWLFLSLRCLVDRTAGFQKRSFQGGCVSCRHASWLKLRVTEEKIAD